MSYKFYVAVMTYKAMKREQLLKNLEEQYRTEFAGKFYPKEFKAEGALTECNFGGKYIILSTDGTMCIVWSDWGDDAISESLKELPIEYEEIEGDIVSGFYLNNEFYRLDNF